MDEDRLIARARRGDGEAFSELVLRYQDMVYNVAYRILGDEQDATDATQDAFLSAYQAVGKFRGGSFRGWLLRIVTNASYDCLRRAKRYAAVSLDDGEAIDWHECVADPGELPEESAERQELGRRIQRGLMALSLKHRVVLVLVDLQGLSYAEAAHVLRVPLGTVRSRVSRGRRALRDLMLRQMQGVSSCQSECELMGAPSVALTKEERAGTEARPYGAEGSKARTAGGDTLTRTCGSMLSAGSDLPLQRR
jgi:RNA polymerase sigma-70 factor (ECF subfamily)